MGLLLLLCGDISSFFASLFHYTFKTIHICVTSSWVCKFLGKGGQSTSNEDSTEITCNEIMNYQDKHDIKSKFETCLDGLALNLSLFDTESAAVNSYGDQPDGRKNSTRGQSPLLSSGHSQTDGRGNVSLDHGAESVKVGLTLQSRTMNDRVSHERIRGDAYTVTMALGKAKNVSKTETLFMT